jgi:type II secretory pathway component PulL
MLGGAAAKDSSVFGPIVAAWVQAVGSVIAIFASAAIAMHVDQRAAARLRKDRAEAANSHFNAGRQAIIVAEIRLNEVRKALDNANGVAAALDHRSLKAAVETSVEMLDFYRSRGELSPSLVYANIAVRKIMNDLLTILQDYDNRADGFASIGKGLPSAQDAVRQCLVLLEADDAKSSGR